jgi:heme/copper-type cytochrome/quinol oxidase subunit 3
MLAAAASLAGGMVAVGVVAAVALQITLAQTYSIYADWHTGQRFSLGLDIAATIVLTMVTVVVMLATRRVTVQSAQIIAGGLAAALVFACAFPSVGWFWLIFQDGLPSDQEFILETYGSWYYPVVGVFGAGYVLAAAAAAILLLVPRPTSAVPEN